MREGEDRESRPFRARSSSDRRASNRAANPFLAGQIAQRLHVVQPAGRHERPHRRALVVAVLHQKVPVRA